MKNIEKLGKMIQIKINNNKKQNQKNPRKTNKLI